MKKERSPMLSQSGRISLGFLILLLLLFVVVGGGSWLYFSGQKTSVAPLDSLISQLKGTPQDDNTDPMTHTADDGHDHSMDTQGDGHDHSLTGDGDVPGFQGQVYDKPVNDLLGVRSLGDPNAKFQIREFFSLTCNHCANFHTGAFQDLKRKYIDTGKVHFIFEEFPLNGPALYASMIARCMPQERYASFIELLLKNQDEWAFSGDFKSALKQNAALAGMSEEAFDACYSNADLQKAIALNIQDSSNVWKISSTPSFVVNNGERILSGAQTLEQFEDVFYHLTGGDAAFVGRDPAQAVAPAQNPAPQVEPVAPTQPTEPTFKTDINDLDIQETITETIEEPTPPSAPETPIEDTTLDLNDLYTP